MANDALLPGGILSMTGAAADRILAANNGDAALLYLYLLRKGGAFDATAAERALKWSADRMPRAYTALVDMGLAAPAVPDASGRGGSAPEAAEEPPEYTADDIMKELEDTASTFPGLVGEVQRRLGKVLSTADLKSLYTIYDFLALPAEVICLLVSFCVEDMEHKYGAGHKPRMSQLRKEAFAWHRLGLDTMERAEEHLKRQAQLRGRERSVLPLVGIQGRAPVADERKFIAAWVDMGFPDDVIRLAYEKTVFKKQSMSWPYMNSILRSWHQKGLHTMAQIKTGDSDRPAYTAPAPAAPVTPTQNTQRVSEDVAWMKEFLAKQKKGDA